MSRHSLTGIRKPKPKEAVIRTIRWWCSQNTRRHPFMLTFMLCSIKRKGIIPLAIALGAVLRHTPCNTGKVRCIIQLHRDTAKDTAKEINKSSPHKSLAEKECVGGPHPLYLWSAWQHVMLAPSASLRVLPIEELLSLSPMTFLNCTLKPNHKHSNENGYHPPALTK